MAVHPEHRGFLQDCFVFILLQSNRLQLYLQKPHHLYLHPTKPITPITITATASTIIATCTTCPYIITSTPTPTILTTSPSSTTTNTSNTSTFTNIYTTSTSVSTVTTTQKFHSLLVQRKWRFSKLYDIRNLYHSWLGRSVTTNVVLGQKLMEL